ncbi:hypothetical protein BMT55_00100 [Listeria newyorkensis]|uniref:Lipoprotein n=1 Tax=Listeria newyorkensis TaxID=1497681 RepID=A0ABX4XR85_9LIST|nr:hypothetical protein [Listeria newyorkensis]PNP94792.1 hypothetical protein BMT55_00100 [Listeria newyorkensis]
MNKRKFNLLLVCILTFGLSACGEPKLTINDNPKERFRIVYEGETDSKAKVSFIDETDTTEKEKVDNEGKFSISVPRLVSTQTYTVKSKLDDKVSSAEIKVTGQKKLINFDDLRDQFNYTSENEDSLSIEIPESIESGNDFSPGFALSTDGPNVMAIHLSQGTGGIDSTVEFTYAIAAITLALKSDNDLKKILDAYSKSVDEEKETRVTVDGTVYEFITVSDIVTSLMIYPKSN